MLNTRRDGQSKNDGMARPPMPRAPNIAPPASPVLQPVYDEEVLRVAQRDFDNKRMIRELEAERDDWRRKCLAAEEDNRRLQARLDHDREAHGAEVDKLADQRDRKIEELMQQRDNFKLALARFETKIGVQGKAVIDLANSISKTILETMDDLKGEKDAPDVAGAAGLAAIADELDPSLDPLPRVIAAGPAQE